MSTFKAPVKDQLFTLEAVGEINKIQQLPEFSEVTDELIEMILPEAAKFAEDVIAPLNWPGDQQGVKVKDGAVYEADGFKEAYQQYHQAGWVGITGDPEFGGQGQPKVVGAAVSETVMAAALSFAVCPTLSQGAISAIGQHGSDAQKAKYLPKLITGEWTGTMNLTEPQAGSDLGLIKTMATPEGDHYRIKGQKIFITWGDHQMTDNIVHLVLARTPDAPEGSGGLSLFIAPKYLVNDDGSLGEKNDITVVSVEHKLGIHASPTCVMGFGENEGAIGYLVGQVNRGLQGMFTMMNHARLEVGLQGLGVSERAYQHALAYAKERVQGGNKRIVEHGDVRRMLLQMKAATEGSRALGYTALSSADFAETGDMNAHQRLDLLTPIAKGWMTEMVNEITSQGIQIHGGMGFIEETGAAQHYRDARILAIYEGTNGIQANDLLFRKVMRDQGAAMSALIKDMQETVEQSSTNNANIERIKRDVAASIAQLESTTNTILSEKPKHLESCAFDYLMMTGYVVVGWLMLKKALLAEQKITEQGADQEFLESKIRTALVFAVSMLPRASAHAETIAAELDLNSVLGTTEVAL